MLSYATGFFFVKFEDYVSLGKYLSKIKTTIHHFLKLKSRANTMYFLKFGSLLTVVLKLWLQAGEDPECPVYWFVRCVLQSTLCTYSNKMGSLCSCAPKL